MTSNLRLFIPGQIVGMSRIQLEKPDIHYLLNVMKVKNQEEINIFNERDGEWVAKVNILTKENVFLLPIKNTRIDITASKVVLAFALLKRQNNSLVIQKATELNVREIYPMITERTIVKTANIEKLKLVAKEAAEQCGRLNIPKIHNTLNTDELIRKSKQNNIILCNNKEESEHILKLQTKIDYKKDSVILIGPEGGFSQNEFVYLNSSANVFNVSLGKLTLRAETAAITSLFLIQAMYNLNRNDKKSGS